MIGRREGTKNGYLLDGTSNSNDFIKILSSYKKVNCIICNEKTAERIQSSFLSKIWFKKPVTIRKNLEDLVFYINGCY